MRVLVLYATSHGHTRKVARCVMEALAQTGCSVELLAISDADVVDFDNYDGVALAAAVHGNRYPSELSDFINRNSVPLTKIPTLFISASLTAAGHDAEDWLGLERVEKNLKDATGWKPSRTEQIAGAYQPSGYDIFTRFIMRRIITEKDPELDPDVDHEYTDWDSLDQAIREWKATFLQTQH